MRKANVILRLAVNDIRSRYASSFLGVLWAFVMPLITIFVFWYVFQIGLRNMPVGDVPYILWFSVAYIPWIFFTDALTSGCNCLIEYSYLVKKIKFDVRFIPAVKVVSALTVHLCFILVLCLMKLVYGMGFGVYMLQAVYYTFAAAVLALGMVYLLSALAVFMKDTVSIVNVLVQIGFWVTPIMWNEDTMASESVRRVLSINPMHYVITGYRDAFLEGRWFWERGESLYFWGLTAAVFACGVLVFKKLRPYFADEV